MQDNEVFEFLEGANCRRIKNYRQKLKEDLVKYKGGECQICGYHKCLEALEFHHLDPAKKDFSISSSDVLSYDKMKEEVDKCILVCANCHREIHHEEYEKMRKEALTKEKEVFTEIMKNREKYSAVSRVKDSYKYLVDAGVLKDMENGMKRIDIRKKYHINNRTFNKFLKENGLTYGERKIVQNKPSKEELIALLEKHSKSSIARMFGVSWNAVQKWCKKYDLVSKE